MTRRDLPLLVYVHFPYCLQKCPYCDFVSYATDAASIDHEGYARAVEGELAARLALLGREPFAPRLYSVFFGGGTPSLSAPDALGRVLDLMWEDRALARRMGEAARARYNALSISWDRILECLLG